MTKKVSFLGTRRAPKRVNVVFSGKRKKISFLATQRKPKPIKIDFRTRKHGTPKQVGKKFPILEKKKLPAKISISGGKMPTKCPKCGSSMIWYKGKTKSGKKVYGCEHCGNSFQPQGGKVMPGPKVWTAEHGWLPKEEYEKTPRAAEERKAAAEFKERLQRRLESKKFTRPGVFELGREIFVLKPNRSKTGFYTLKLVEKKAKRVTEEGEHVPFDFEYAPDAIYKLTESDRMPLSRAKQFMVRYGRCLACGRKLKVAKSVERGLGPVCKKYFG